MLNIYNKVSNILLPLSKDYIFHKKKFLRFGYLYNLLEKGSNSSVSNSQLNSRDQHIV